MPSYISHYDAAKVLGNAERILVVGCSGGGKTTLSRKIANILGIQYYSIDRDVRWLPEWKERDKQEQRIILNRLVQNDRWVMDGSGASTFDIRLPRTDLVLWVRVPRYAALLGIVSRVIRYFGTVRPHMAEGCPEPLPDKEFLSYVWNFEEKYAPVFVRYIDLHGPNVPVAILKSHSEIDSLVHAIQESMAHA